jgi:hypothetical protein
MLIKSLHFLDFATIYPQSQGAITDLRLSVKRRCFEIFRGIPSDIHGVPLLTAENASALSAFAHSDKYIVKEYYTKSAKYSILYNILFSI